MIQISGHPFGGIAPNFMYLMFITRSRANSKLMNMTQEGILRYCYCPIFRDDIALLYEWKISIIYEIVIVGDFAETFLMQLA